ncbi:M48 family metalloprotease [Parasphingopyxis sp. CP4]|uniref:M48 family metalloprotease n=1 Tax=Parasphingopyxis sp. CP4 TaxID=2724527 RepID=UPI0015A19D79|nr:M48 family metalloprotease [Parasphingopyxis sp. CP4]QLC21153.1 M48 family metalloprotease [Parasphingopyxis sp. CP4]
MAKLRIALLLSAAVVTGSCAGLPLPGSGPAAGEAISQQERQQGAQAHAQLLQQFGDAYSGRQSAYVVQIGRRIAVESGLSNAQNDFTVTLLNSPVNNAFALPGGYVYITRNLVGLMNNEAELASVMGHEVGHVAARHSSRRQSTSTITQILAVGLGLLTGSGDLANLAGQAAQLYTLRYSRSQEYEADELGITYLTRAGYDPFAAAGMLSSLAAQTSLNARIAGREARSLPEWASTHPDPGARVSRARNTASATGAVAGGGTNNREVFLNAIDGMLYDDDPAQGVIDGNTFRHPDLRLQFTVPQGYTMQNGTSAVVVTGQNGQAQFGGGQHSGSLSDHVARVFRELGGNQRQINYGNVTSSRINGIPVAQASARVASGSNQVDVTVTAYDFGSNRKYHFMTVTRAGQGIGPFNSMIRSVARLSSSEAAAIRPRVIDVVTVRRGDTISGLASRMAYQSNQEARFRVLNALGSGDSLRAGQRVKLVVFGR